jgi:predicted dehydrogenase
MDSNVKTIKVAFIGAGYMASEHIKAFADIPNVFLAGIQSRTKSKAEALASKYNIGKTYTTIPELYEGTKADLVVVTVPILTMNEVSKACFKFPWVVLLEKPAGYNLEDAQDIFKASQKAGGKVFVALNRRFYSSTVSVFEDLGKLKGQRFIKVQDQQIQRVELEAGQPELVVKNYMYANSIHTIDYFRNLGRGKIASVHPIVKWDPHNPGIVIAKIEFESGDLGLYEGIWNGPGPWAVTVNTEEKRWEMRPLEKATFQLAGKRTLESVELHAWDQQFKPGLRLQAEHAILSVQGKPSKSVTLAESLESMEIVHKIFEM